MPATAEVVIEEGLQEHLVHVGFVDVICTGKRSDIICKHAKDHRSLYGQDNSGSSGALFILAMNVFCSSMKWEGRAVPHIAFPGFAGEKKSL